MPYTTIESRTVGVTGLDETYSLAAPLAAAEAWQSVRLTASTLSAVGAAPLSASIEWAVQLDILYSDGEVTDGIPLLDGEATREITMTLYNAAGAAVASRSTEVLLTDDGEIYQITVDPDQTSRVGEIQGNAGRLVIRWDEDDDNPCPDVGTYRWVLTAASGLAVGADVLARGTIEVVQ